MSAWTLQELLAPKTIHIYNSEQKTYLNPPQSQRLLHHHWGTGICCLCCSKNALCASSRRSGST
ncbi:hypothetical protein J3R82DRAFT_1965 [Butyriboletus roseoflavus]|nr:hypothetical protein J3R82DRAFT_1965 [Butyriboletus roseoflavus]